MIARIFIPIILSVILSDLYIDWLFRRRFHSYKTWKRLLWWFPGILIIANTLYFATQINFAPDNLLWFFDYLFITGIVVIPEVIFTICSLLGRLLSHITHSRHNWGNIISPLFCAIALYILIYGSTVGTQKVVVKHVEVYSYDLPAEFNNYRITLFSDAHVGSLIGSRAAILTSVVDSINDQHADIVVFAGDIQDAHPSELRPFLGTLSRIEARDGVYSILGNHDYSHYIKASSTTEMENKRELIALERQCGWTVLLNQNHVIRRENDSIVIAGEENSGKPPYPSYADLGKTLSGISQKAFTVLLQHDPSAWDRSVLPHSRAQLTLSGHTHGGQLSLFGFRPTELTYKQDAGLYKNGDRWLCVSTGIGGLVPFRFADPPEIVVITLTKVGIK